MENKKYVVLEHLTLPDRGFRFWSTNSENNTHGSTGELWYKEILFTDSKQEAINACCEVNEEAIPKFSELVEYHMNKEREKLHVIKANIVKDR